MLSPEMPRGPVFVSGCPRSGTSALGWAIAACPEYWTSVETHFFFYLLAGEGRNKIHDAYKSSAEPDSWLNKHDVPYGEFLAHLGNGLNGLMRSRSGQVQWVDNSPENILVGDDLLLMFEDAVVVHVIRDPREVCASMFLSGFSSEPWAQDVDQGIATWKHYASTGRSLKSRHPGRVIEVMHRDMLLNPSQVARDLGEQLSISDSAPIADFLESSRVNSSYDAGSQLRDAAVQSTSASQQQRSAFLKKHGAHILAECQPYARSFGFAEAR